MTSLVVLIVAFLGAVVLVELFHMFSSLVETVQRYGYLKFRWKLLKDKITDEKFIEVVESAIFNYDKQLISEGGEDGNKERS